MPRVPPVQLDLQERRAQQVRKEQRAQQALVAFLDHEELQVIRAILVQLGGLEKRESMVPQVPEEVLVLLVQPDLLAKTAILGQRAIKVLLAREDRLEMLVQLDQRDLRAIKELQDPQPFKAWQEHLENKAKLDQQVMQEVPAIMALLGTSDLKGNQDPMDLRAILDQKDPKVHKGRLLLGLLACKDLLVLLVLLEKLVRVFLDLKVLQVCLAILDQLVILENVGPWVILDHRVLPGGRVPLVRQESVHKL